MNLTTRQKDIINRMRNGYILLIGQSEDNGRYYYQVTKGYERIYFNATVFSNLLNKEMIYQEQNYPFDYVLTKLGKTIEL